MRSINLFVVHHSASSLETTVADLEDWHIDDRGYEYVGYHIFIDGEGTIHFTRPFNKQGAHAKGANVNSIGICLAGNNTIPDQKWTGIQLIQLNNVLSGLDFFFPSCKTRGHREVGKTPTICPGVDIKDILPNRHLG